MFANKYYERDIKYTFEMNRFFCRMVGMWPLARTNIFLLDVLERSSLVLVCLVLLLFELISVILYILIVVKNISLRIKIMGSAIFATVVIVKYGYVLLYKSQIKNCLMLIDEDWRDVISPSARVSMLDRIRIGRRLLVTFAVFVYVTNLSVRVVTPIATGKIVTLQNKTIRPLPLVAHLVIFDVQCTPVYEIVFSMQVISGFIKYTIMVATFGFVTLCAMHFCAQLDILVTLMNNFVNERQFENLSMRLTTIVEHQIKTRNFLQSVQNATQYISLIEVVGSTVMVCFAEYYVIVEWEDHNAVRIFTYILVLVMFSFNIFIYCYMGEQVVEQGEKIALTACTLEWYHLPDDKARALILIMAISQTPLKLKAGKLMDLSLRTFCNILKMAITYLSLLRSVE